MKDVKCRIFIANVQNILRLEDRINEFLSSQVNEFVSATQDNLSDDKTIVCVWYTWITADLVNSKSDNPPGFQ